MNGRYKWVFILLCITISIHAQQYDITYRPSGNYSNWNTGVSYQQSNQPGRIGYTTKYGNSFQYDEQVINSDYRLVTYTLSSSPYKAPSAEKNEWDGYEEYGKVRIYWKVTKDVWGIYFFTIAYSDGTSEKHHGLFDEDGAISRAKEVAKQKAQDQAMSVPIGNPPLILFAILLLAYMSYDILVKPVLNKG